MRRKRTNNQISENIFFRTFASKLQDLSVSSQMRTSGTTVELKNKCNSVEKEVIKKTRKQ
jgi:hypothetical protein